MEEGSGLLRLNPILEPRVSGNVFAGKDVPAVVC